MHYRQQQCTKQLLSGLKSSWKTEEGLGLGGWWRGLVGGGGGGVGGWGWGVGGKVPLQRLEEGGGGGGMRVRVSDWSYLSLLSHTNCGNILQPRERGRRKERNRGRDIEKGDRERERRD